MRFPFSRALCAAFVLFPIAHRAVVAQAPNLLQTDLSKWTLSANPKDVKLTAGPNDITVQWILGGSRFSVFAASTSFVAPRTGAYSLWLNAEVNYGGSRDDATWLIPGVGSEKWRQRDDGGRDVAQWIVPLQKNQQYTLHILVPIREYGTSAWLRPASLIPVELPVLEPGLVWRFEGRSLGSYRVVSDRVLQQPVYVLFAWPQLAQQPVPLPFGALWLGQPLPIWVRTKANWYPTNRSEAEEAYRVLRSGLYWQVLEFDAAAPGTTMRLGSAVQTKSWDLR